MRPTRGPNRITNSRWALSAFGTATAGALTREDTVYSINPLSHPAGLLTSVGGAVAGGARLALASSFDVDTFWEEVRRYGVTVVSYVWAQLRDIVEAPPNPFERHHAIRLLVGSGMPPSLWRRAEDRFAPGPRARVLGRHRGRGRARQRPRRQARLPGPAAAGQRRAAGRPLRHRNAAS